MCYERATDTSCVAGNRMILLDRLGETATICTNLTTTPISRTLHTLIARAQVQGACGVCAECGVEFDDDDVFHICPCLGSCRGGDCRRADAHTPQRSCQDSRSDWRVRPLRAGAGLDSKTGVYAQRVRKTRTPPSSEIRPGVLRRLPDNMLPVSPRGYFRGNMVSRGSVPEA
jgi:hypothetical protein